MAGRFQQALPFYQKAEKLYGTIGDRVSYAYTLWSIGTTYKMLGQYTQAWSAFQKADNLFKKTGDTRGRIYSLLGFAEVEWLKAKDPLFPLRLSSLSPKAKWKPGQYRLPMGLKLKGGMRERARVRGGVSWKKAKSIADKSDYAWERLGYLSCAARRHIRRKGTQAAI